MLSNLLINAVELTKTVLSVAGSCGPPVGQRPEGRILPFSSPAGRRGWTQRGRLLMLSDVAAYSVCPAAAGAHHR